MSHTRAFIPPLTLSQPPNLQPRYLFTSPSLAYRMASQTKRQTDRTPSSALCSAVFTGLCFCNRKMLRGCACREQSVLFCSQPVLPNARACVRGVFRREVVYSVVSAGRERYVAGVKGGKSAMPVPKLQVHPVHFSSSAQSKASMWLAEQPRREICFRGAECEVVISCRVVSCRGAIPLTDG